MYKNIYVCVHMCIYVCVCVCIYICMYLPSIRMRIGRYKVHRDDVIGYIATYLSIQEYDDILEPQKEIWRKILELAGRPPSQCPSMSLSMSLPLYVPVYVPLCPSVSLCRFPD